MKVLVTGGAGFIGSHLVDRLIMEGHQVVVVDNLATGKKKNLNPAAKFYKEDITSPRLGKIFKTERPELVSHHAAQMDVRRSVSDPIFDAETNINGTINLLECAVKNGTRRIIFASSGGAVYGEQERFPADETHPTYPLSPYGISKKAGELYMHYYEKVYGLKFSAMRYANVYGPRQDPFGEAGVVAIFTSKLLKKEQPVINGNGMQTRDYCYVQDVVNANMAVINGNGDGIYNVGTGVETSVNELFRLIADAVGSDMKEAYGPAKKGEQKRSVLDSGKLRDTFDWEPAVTMEEGLKETAKFFSKL